MKLKVLFIALLVGSVSNAQTTVDLNSSKDNSIFSENSNSNGQGSLFSGAISNGDSRRALLSFDLNGIPSTATILSASIEFTITRTRSTNSPYTLHRLELDWGEGSSLATGAGGLGAPAQAPDATWQDAMFQTASWNTPGGDFIATASAANTIDSNDATVTFDSAGLTDDIQNWVDGTNSNFGWILIGDETGSRNASRFDSREGTNPPVLTITYTTTAGIERASLSSKVRISPNPATHFFTLQIDQNTSSTQVDIFDILGSKVFGAKRPAADRYNFNLDLPGGIYIVKIQQDQEATTRKLIIK